MLCSRPTHQRTGRPAVIDKVQPEVRAPCVQHLSLERGVLRVSTAIGDGDDPAQTGAGWRTSMRCVRERPAVDVSDADFTGAFRVSGADALVRRVRDAFDPRGVLNPGILA